MKLQSFKTHCWLSEELLTEGVPKQVMGIYERWLGDSGGSVHAVQSVHMQLMTVWYCLDFHWDKNRPWVATDKGMQIMEKVSKGLKQKSDMATGLTQGLINDSTKNCRRVWDSIFEHKDNKKEWGVSPNHKLKWVTSAQLFDLSDASNPYGDIGGKSPLRGDGFYQKLFIQKKMIKASKPGMMNTDDNQTAGKWKG